MWANTNISLFICCWPTVAALDRNQNQHVYIIRKYDSGLYYEITLTAFRIIMMATDRQIAYFWRGSVATDFRGNDDKPTPIDHYDRVYPL